MSITDSLSQLFTSFEFWRFYCVAIFAVIAIHTLINLLIDNVFENTRWVHMGLFLLIVAPLSFGLSGIYFSPFGDSKEPTKLVKINLGENKNPPKKVEKALPEITIINNAKATGDTTTPMSEVTPATDSKSTETQLPPVSSSSNDAENNGTDDNADTELIREFRDAIK